jgi:hypothetical protein
MNTKSRLVATLLGTFAFAAGCSDSSTLGQLQRGDGSTSEGSGGVSGKGGYTGTGGNDGLGGYTGTGSGGDDGFGGSYGTGGFTYGTGGFYGTGGSTGSGGYTGTGGFTYGTGGYYGSGGSTGSGGFDFGTGGVSGEGGVGGDFGTGGAGTGGAPGPSCPTPGAAATPTTIPAFRTAITRKWVMCSQSFQSNALGYGDIEIKADDRYWHLERTVSGRLVGIPGVDSEGTVVYGMTDFGAVQTTFRSDLNVVFVVAPVITANPTMLIMKTADSDNRYVPAEP